MLEGAYVDRFQQSGCEQTTKIGLNKGVLTFVSDKFSIDRQKWDIAYQSSMKDVVIKDDIDLQVNFTAK